MPAPNLIINFGPSKTGLAATVGYRLLDFDGTPLAARVGGTMVEIGAGVYSLYAVGATAAVFVRFDTGEVTPRVVVGQPELSVEQINTLVTEIAKIPRAGETFVHRNTATNATATVIIE